MKAVRKFWLRWRLPLTIFVLAIGVLLNVIAFLQLLTSQPVQVSKADLQTTASPSPQLSVTQPGQSQMPELGTISVPPIQPRLIQPKLGHFPYAEIDPSQRILIASYAQDEYQRFEYMSVEAGKSLMKLIYAARDQGVWIVPVSGFRSIEKQKELFERQIKRQGSESAAAKLSAPPGYSEHSTGYAIDLTDGNFPQQDITYKFAESKAYKWLLTHANKFGFELSFPANNSQGVSYEPWHWRYVGSSQAAQIFAQARDRQKS
jgi:zinc D-Ala-D-Ala carboxypeptidase